MQVQLYMHVLEVPSEKKKANSAQRRMAPFRLRYQDDDKHGDQSVDPKAVLEFVFS